MTEIQPLDGSPELLDALRAVLEHEEDLFGWAHNEEHFFQHTEYCGLVKVFDKKVADARERRRPILNRIFQLGGMIDGVVPGPEDALRTLLVKLRMTHAACQDAYSAAEGDYVTQEILTANQRHLEKCIEKISQKLNKRLLIGDQLWLDRLV